jgi:N-acetylglutamate synthase-like GNAT family acetyltransferase
MLFQVDSSLIDRIRRLATCFRIELFFLLSSSTAEFFLSITVKEITSTKISEENKEKCQEKRGKQKNSKIQISNTLQDRPNI